MSESEEALRVHTPIGVDYGWSAGPRSTAYLEGLLEGRLLGKRCPSCAKVYFPPRNGTCPMCGVLLGDDDVEVGPNGTITTFCVVNVPFLGQKITPPYVAATILLDGADIGVQHLILEIDAADVRMGMRVEPVWKDPAEWVPSLENISHFRPNGEPDRDFSDYAGQL
jgi:uncharacterized OB-fold protein